MFERMGSEPADELILHHCAPAVGGRVVHGFPTVDARVFRLRTFIVNGGARANSQIEPTRGPSCSICRRGARLIWNVMRPGDETGRELVHSGN